MHAVERVRVRVGEFADREAVVLRRRAYGDAPRTLEVCEVEVWEAGRYVRRLYWASELLPMQ